MKHPITRYLTLLLYIGLASATYGQGSLGPARWEWASVYGAPAGGSTGGNYGYGFLRPVFSDTALKRVFILSRSTPYYDFDFQYSAGMVPRIPARVRHTQTLLSCVSESGQLLWCRPLPGDSINGSRSGGRSGGLSPDLLEYSSKTKSLHFRFAANSDCSSPLFPITSWAHNFNLPDTAFNGRSSQVVEPNRDLPRLCDADYAGIFDAVTGRYLKPKVYPYPDTSYWQFGSEGPFGSNFYFGGSIKTSPTYFGRPIATSPNAAFWKSSMAPDLYFTRPLFRVDESTNNVIASRALEGQTPIVKMCKSYGLQNEKLLVGIRFKGTFVVRPGDTLRSAFPRRFENTEFDDVIVAYDSNLNVIERWYLDEGGKVMSMHPDGKGGLEVFIEANGAVDGVTFRPSYLNDSLQISNTPRTNNLYGQNLFNLNGTTSHLRRRWIRLVGRPSGNQPQIIGIVPSRDGGSVATILNTNPPDPATRYGLTTLDLQANQRAALMGLDSLGQAVWALVSDSLPITEACQIAQASNGRVWLFNLNDIQGNFLASIRRHVGMLHPHVLDYAGGSNFLALIAPLPSLLPLPVGNKPKQEEEARLRAYPNPATNLLNISCNARAAGKISNLLGQQLMSFQTNAEGKATLDVKALPIGIYIITSGTQATRFVKR